jgi:hypothetical protein
MHGGKHWWALVSGTGSHVVLATGEQSEALRRQHAAASGATTSRFQLTDDQVRRFGIRERLQVVPYELVSELLAGGQGR